jgi:mRNA-degrading endonuclease RelE of RelBE toxin-antitoxin system
MFKLVINEFAEETMEKVFQKEKMAFRRLADALDDLEQKGLLSSNVKSLKNAPKIFRKRVGRWRVLFTIKAQIIDVWIIAIEKDTDKDYRRWISYIASQC